MTSRKYTIIIIVLWGIMHCVGCANTYNNNVDVIGYVSPITEVHTRSISQVPTATAPYAVGDLVVNWSSRKTIPGANSYNEYKMEMDYKYELQLTEPDSTYRYVALQSNYVEVVNPTDNTRSQYIVTYIPDKSYLGRYNTVAASRGIDCDIVPEFYGVILYSLLSGEPVAAYECKYGYLLNEVFVFDTTLNSDEKNERFFSIMEGKRIAISAKSESSTYTITDEEGNIVGGVIVCDYDSNGYAVLIDEVTITQVQDVSTVINDGGNGGGTQPIVYTMFPPDNPMGCLNTLSGGDTYIPQPPPTSSVFEVSLLNIDNFCGYSEVNDLSCKDLCNLICSKHGLTSNGSPYQVYKLMYERDGQAPGSRELVHYGNNVAENYANAINCIDEHLEQGRVIIVGVNHSITTIKQNGEYINEGTTDHFVVVYGRGFDSTKGMTYYNYYEVGRSSKTDGCDDNNRLYYDNHNFLLFDDSIYRKKAERYDVTQVRPNNGNIEGTVSQYAQ